MSAISSLPQGLLAAAARILNGETTPKGEVLVEHVGLAPEAFDAALVKCFEAIEMKSISPEEKAKRKKGAEEYRASWVAKNVKNEDLDEDLEDLYVTEAELSEDLGISTNLDEGYDPADVKKLKSLVKTHKKNVAKVKAHDAKMEPSYAATGNTVGHNTQKARGHMYTNTKHHMNADDSRNAVHDHVNKMKGLPPGGSEAKHLIKHGFKHNAERSAANGHAIYEKGASSGHFPAPAHSVHIHGNRFSHTKGASSFSEKTDHMKNLGSYLAKTKTDHSIKEDLDEDSGANVHVAHQAVMKSAEEIAAIRKNKGTKEEYGKALVAHSNATQHLSNMVKAHAAEFMPKN
jgi:hypothetical protein